MPQVLREDEGTAVGWEAPRVDIEGKVIFEAVRKRASFTRLEMAAILG